MINHRPKLLIVAGPNGSGKTTITEQGLAHEWFDGCLYINPDAIAQEDFGDWNNRDSIINAAQKATRLRYEAVEQGKSLAFETVFSSAEKLDFIHLAKKKGYFIRLFFVCTESPTINAARIAQRVIQGGHEVPISKIISRYGKSIINAYQAVKMVDRLYLYDNSIDDVAPRLIARFQDGRLVRRYVDSVPMWSQDFMETPIQ